MNLATSRVRQRVSESIQTLEGWRESTHAPDLFGRDPDRVTHHVFAVALPTTAVHSQEGRQRLSEGALVVSEVVVTWAHRLRGDAINTDMDEALDAEGQLIRVVLGGTRTDLHLVLTDSRRTTATEGWLIGTTRFRAVHRMALQD